jgi:hypothetical protein
MAAGPQIDVARTLEAELLVPQGSHPTGVGKAQLANAARKDGFLDCHQSR